MAFVANFSKYTQYDETSSTQSIRWGAGGPVTELDLNEMQLVESNQRRSSLKALFGDGFVGQGSIAYSASTLTITNEVAFVNGYFVYIDKISLASVPASKQIYLDVWLETITKDGIMYKYGNTQGTKLTNYIADARFSNVEITRREQIQYAFRTDVTAIKGVGLAIGILNGSTFTFNYKLLSTKKADNATNADSADVAVKLKTARTINGVSFDATKNIEITAKPTNTTLSTENLNDILDVGFYSAGGANTVTNKPPSCDAFGLIVSKVASGYIQQELTYGNTDQFKKVYRICTNTTTKVWTEWGQVYTSSHPQTNLKGDVVGNVTGNADTATKLKTARKIELTGDVTGNGNFDGSSNISITATVADDSHNHTQMDKVDITGKTLDLDTLNLATGTPQKIEYVERTNGGATGITNIPITDNPFSLVVEVIRWVGTNDYITKQTFVSTSTKTTFERFCTNGVWTSWLPNATFNETPVAGQVLVADGVNGGVKSSGYTIGTSVPIGAKFTDTVYSHPTTSGNKHIPSGGSSNQILRWTSDGTAVWSNENNTTYGNATTTTSGLMSNTDKAKLDGIATNANNYSHPTGSGNNHVPTGGSANQILRWSSDGTAVWSNENNTTYSVATTKANGLMSSSDKTKLDGVATNANNYSHPTTSGNKHIPSGGVSGNILKWSSDGTAVWGSETTYSNATTSVDGLMSSTDKSKLDGIATNANNYSHPTTSGNKHVPSGGSSNQILRWSSDGTAVWSNENNTTYSNATTTTSGLMSNTDKAKLDGIEASANNYSHPTTSGNKHVPSGGSANQILRWSADGTAVWSNENNTTYSVATTSANGLMSSTDKTKLDGIATNANNYSHPTGSGNKHIPSGGSSGQILRWSADGTAVWGADNNTTYSVATTTANGLMSSTDKAKLDGVEANANNYTHPGSGTNPHGTTKSDVGLGSVSNYGIATQTEAEAGTSDAKYMTPLKVKQAIDRNKVKPRRSRIMVSAGSWSGTTAPYSATITVGGVTSSSFVLFDIRNDYADATSIKEFNEALLAINSLGTGSLVMRAYGTKPTASMYLDFLVINEYQ